MITIGFRFPAGRYHATPWGHQVNEGQVEWPPSPWRILRALISSGFTRLGWNDPPESSAVELINALSASLPTYTVPRASIAHSRHYMPIGQFRTGTELEGTTLVLDTWANIENEELQIHWDVDISIDQRALLSALVEQLNYLGRSESWAIGRLLPADEAPLPADVILHEPGTPIDHGMELISLMACVSNKAYAQWCGGRVLQPETAVKTKAAKTKKSKAKEPSQSPYPSDLFTALQWDTRKWQSLGWSQPPGSQWAQYRRSRGALAPSASSISPLIRRFVPADLVLLALASASGSRGLLPSITRALPQGELLHDAVVKRASADGQVPPEEITGKDSSGQPLLAHRHCHILHLDLDRDGHLDHVLFWAKQGFSQTAQEAITGLRRTFTKGGKEALRVAVAGRAVQAKAAKWPEGLEAFVGASRLWTSETPFVAPRFVKCSGANSLEGQIRAELVSRGFPDPVEVTIDRLPRGDVENERLAPLFRHFVRARGRGGKPPPQDAGWYVEIKFGEAVTGPICIGYGSHFGLGVMRKG